MALPPYDFLSSAPTDQLGTSLGTDFDYLNAFRSGQGIRNDIDYSGQPMPAVMPPSFTIGDNPDVISDMSLADYYNFQKYMRERGAADLINPQNKIAPIDGGSDSKGIGEIILPPIAGGGGGGGGGVTPEFLKTYTTGATADKSQAVDVDGTTMLDVPSTQVLGTGVIPAYGLGGGKYPTDFTLGNVYTGEFDAFDEGTVFDSTEPKQNLLQKGITGIKDFFGKFSSPKIQGQLGTRLANQYTMGQKLPSFIGAIATMQSPFNPKSKNYNPLLENQLNIAEANDKIGRDPSGTLKYNTNSVLSGQNVISGFGTNDYEKQLENYLDKVQGVFDKKYGDVDITEYEDFSLKDLKALDPKNAFDAKKIAAATYKTKYINAAITELDPFKNKTYIEKKKQIKEKIKKEKKTIDTDDSSTTGGGFKYDTDTTGTATSNQYGTYTQTVSPSDAATNRESRRGNYDSSNTKGTNTSASKSSKSSSSKGTNQGYSQHFRKGGRVRRSYFDGGIVTL